MNEELTDFEGCCGLNIVSGFPDDVQSLIAAYAEQREAESYDGDYKKPTIEQALKGYDMDFEVRKSNIAVLNNRQVSLGMGIVLVRHKFEVVKVWKSRATSSTLYLYFRR